MTLGEVMDFCHDYNKAYTADENKSETRKATQADWDSFWG